MNKDKATRIVKLLEEFVKSKIMEHETDHIEDALALDHAREALIEGLLQVDIPR